MERKATLQLFFDSPINQVDFPGAAKYSIQAPQISENPHS
jgi:hypothetical protein